MHIFSQIDLKYTKFQKKADIFSPAAHPLIIFSWVKNINQGGGGKNMNFKFNIQPCCNVHWCRFIFTSFCVAKLEYLLYGV